MFAFFFKYDIILNDKTMGEGGFACFDDLRDRRGLRPFFRLKAAFVRGIYFIFDKNFLNGMDK